MSEHLTRDKLASRILDYVRTGHGRKVTAKSLHNYRYNLMHVGDMDPTMAEILESIAILHIEGYIEMDGDVNISLNRGYSLTSRGAEREVMQRILRKSEVEDNETEQNITDLPSFASILDELSELVVAKQKVYGFSTFKRGGDGLYHNCARKWDRIEIIRKLKSRDKFIQDEANLDRETDPETLYKTIRDLAVYSIQWLRWMKINNS